MNERDLKDPILSRAFRAAAEGDTVPEAWTRAAREIPRTLPHPELAPVPRLRVVLPHLCGLLVLSGAVVGVLTQPEIVRNLFDAVGRSLTVAVSSDGAVTPVMLAGLILPPLLAALGLEASRGFRDVKRLVS